MDVAAYAFDFDNKFDQNKIKISSKKPNFFEMTWNW